ncbi:hypothetical protein HN587_03180 [Candidatus Woesearchaeota archaeon]|jgi:hypothetical protein|nr:hypothetical protein [Candidatus Woesearchaeota archaeon]
MTDDSSQGLNPKSRILLEDHLRELNPNSALVTTVNITLDIDTEQVEQDYVFRKVGLELTLDHESYGSQTFYAGIRSVTMYTTGVETHIEDEKDVEAELLREQIDLERNDQIFDMLIPNYNGPAHEGRLLFSVDLLNLAGAVYETAEKYLQIPNVTVKLNGATVDFETVSVVCRIINFSKQNFSGYDIGPGRHTP